MRLLRRAVRAAYAGTYYEDEIVCGFPCSIWLNLTHQTYSFGVGGKTLLGWPDGKSLIDQEQCVTEILSLVSSEILQVINDA